MTPKHFWEQIRIAELAADLIKRAKASGFTNFPIYLEVVNSLAVIFTIV